MTAKLVWKYKRFFGPKEVAEFLDSLGVPMATAAKVVYGTPAEFGTLIVFYLAEE